VSGSLHRELAGGRWWTLSIFEQMGNIGSEVSRALNWRGRNEALSENALARGLELFDLTLSDPRWRPSVCRLREIARAREVMVDFIVGDNVYGSTEESLRRYFDHYAIVARNRAVPKP